ncbi:hypothetical protein J6590_082450 [Homalodisca vitripennis]|nr:hypothetical protein J6590_082450 [Homalodisca vitripennis]
MVAVAPSGWMHTGRANRQVGRGRKCHVPSVPPCVSRHDAVPIPTVLILNILSLRKQA